MVAPEPISPDHLRSPRVGKRWANENGIGGQGLWKSEDGLLACESNVRVPEG
jgi:hypothetical protein